MRFVEEQCGNADLTISYGEGCVVVRVTRGAKTAPIVLSSAQAVVLARELIEMARVSEMP